MQLSAKEFPCQVQCFFFWQISCVETEVFQSLHCSRFWGFGLLDVVIFLNHLGVMSRCSLVWLVSSVMLNDLSLVNCVWLRQILFDCWKERLPHYSGKFTSNQKVLTWSESTKLKWFFWYDSQANFGHMLFPKVTKIGCKESSIW